jgi:hypothetical protein
LLHPELEIGIGVCSDLGNMLAQGDTAKGSDSRARKATDAPADKSANNAKRKLRVRS